MRSARPPARSPRQVNRTRNNRPYWSRAGRRSHYESGLMKIASRGSFAARGRMRSDEIAAVLTLVVHFALWLRIILVPAHITTAVAAIPKTAAASSGSCWPSSPTLSGFCLNQVCGTEDLGWKTARRSLAFPQLFPLMTHARPCGTDRLESLLVALAESHLTRLLFAACCRGFRHCLRCRPPGIGGNLE